MTRLVSAPEVFEAFARGIERYTPETAALLRRCARNPLALSLVPAKPAWDVPHRLVAAVRWLVLAGEVEDFSQAQEPWRAFRAVLGERSDWIARFVREQPVQTNEVQRCFALLPLFLTVSRLARRPLDLIELGTSGGLNLLWDRYRYRYAAGVWGAAGDTIEPSGEERVPVPHALLREPVEVRRRRGIDLKPVDLTSDEGIRLLLSFTGEEVVRERLRGAAGVLRRHPPELIRGDYLELLPGLLRERDDGVLTVVFQTLSTVYLSDEQRARLTEIVEDARRDGPLAWISTPTPEEHGERRGDYPLELAVWPGLERRIVARMDVRGEQLGWIGLGDDRLGPDQSDAIVPPTP